MNEFIIQLGSQQVALAAMLIFVSGVISLQLRLGLERQLAVAAVRTVAQLLLLGCVLGTIFTLKSPLAVGLLVLGMTLVASDTAVRRVQRRYSGVRLDSLAAISVSSWTISAFVLFFILRAEPWFAPQYSIPFAGMILGNSLTAVALGLDRFTTNMATRQEVDALLALGANRWEAARGSVQDAVRTGMTPILNSMMVVGIVSLPGMMTGQLLAGVDPMEAVKYQVVIMFVLAAASSLGVLMAVLLGFRRLLNEDHQFLREHLVPTWRERG